LGSPEPGLSFAAPPLVETGTPSASGTNEVVRSDGSVASKNQAITARSAIDAATLFGDAIVTGRVNEAFDLLPDLEQQRVGSANKFAEVLSRDNGWLSSALDRAETEGEIMALRVTQTPMIDEIRGVVAPSSVVKMPATKEALGWKVSWERRTIAQQFAAPRSRLEADVARWAQARQKQCARTETSSKESDGDGAAGNVDTANGKSSKTAPEGEYSGGLLGAVWLAEELCTVPGLVTISTVGDIYNLDDPQPLLDAYGSGSYQWARVVTLAAPHAMHVIAAPLDQRWVVVGVAPVNSFN
jgi:hypothetical protein